MFPEFFQLKFWLVLLARTFKQNGGKNWKSKSYFLALHQNALHKFWGVCGPEESS